MKGKKMKYPLILSSVMLLGSVLAGCSSSKDENASSGSPSSGSASSGSSAAASDKTAGGVDISKEAKLVYYLWGSEGVANKDILAQINKKLKQDINATIEVKYIDWPDVATKYPLLFASGEKFDMSHASPGAPVSYFSLANQGALVDITDMLDKVAPKLKAEIPEQTWAGAKVNGKIYGVPSLYSEFTPTGFAYRSDLLKKYGMEKIGSIADMEKYMDNVLANESYPPINGNANDAFNMYRMLVDTTDMWINAPGISLTELNLVTKSPDDYKHVFHPAFTQEFEDWAVKMRQWADKGYWPKDILSSQVDAGTNFRAANSAGYLTHAQDWIGKYGTDMKAQPESDPYFYTFAEANHKIKRKLGVENSTVISTNSANPERALMAIEKFMTDPEYYNLIQYGLEGRQYVIEDGVKKTPAGFDDKKDGGGFAAWSLRNDKYNLPMDTENPIRSSLYDEWNKVAINDPYMGFSFDPKNVTTEIAAISNVNQQLGMQLMLGKTSKDPKEAVAEYRKQLKAAGIDKVVAEVEKQLANFEKIG
ncbi:ABC transporter substrate-binding protein [Cohnella sp. 56]|uniref:ABC transporter substrate-binding protein n=1 Tax=Cohnella sp. 56 TaxID=3113722 RepID=UPI0030E8A761